MSTPSLPAILSGIWNNFKNVYKYPGCRWRDNPASCNILLHSHPPIAPADNSLAIIVLSISNNDLK